MDVRQWLHTLDDVLIEREYQVKNSPLENVDDYKRDVKNIKEMIKYLKSELEDE